MNYYKYFLISLVIHSLLLWDFSFYQKSSKKEDLVLIEIKDPQEKKTAKTKPNLPFKSFINKGIGNCAKTYNGIGVSFSKINEDDNLAKIHIKKDGLFLEIKEVQEGSPANKLGLLKGDLIDSEVTNIMKLPVGSKLKVIVYRNNERKDMEIFSEKICFSSKKT